MRQTRKIKRIGLYIVFLVTIYRVRRKISVVPDHDTHDDDQRSRMTRYVPVAAVPVFAVIVVRHRDLDDARRGKNEFAVLPL